MVEQTNKVNAKWEHIEVNNYQQRELRGFLLEGARGTKVAREEFSKIYQSIS